MKPESGRAWLAAAVLAVAAVGAAPASASAHPPGAASKGTLAARGTAARMLLSARRGIAIVAGPASALSGRAIMFSGGPRLASGLTGPASGAGWTARPGGPAGRPAARHTYKLTVTAIGRDGRPANALVDVVDTSVVGGDVHTLSTPHGTGSVKLAAGTYLVQGYIAGTRPTSNTLTLATVGVSAAGTNHITLDARAGRLVDVTVDAPVRRSGQDQLVSTFYKGTRYGWVEGMFATPGTAYIVPAQGRRITFGVQTVLRAADAAGPTEYDLAAVHRGGIPTDLAYHYRAARLAWVHNTYRAPDATSYGDAIWVPGTPAADATSRSALLPIASTNAVSPGVPFYGFFEYGSARSPDRAQIQSSGHVFTAGTQVADVWNGAAVGPAQPATHATRHANAFGYTVDGFFTDGAPASLGHDGEDASVTGTITLSARGTVIATKKYPAQQPGQFTATLPRAPATYTLTATAQRNVSYARLSTSVTAAWRFRSGYAAGRQALPLLAVRYQVPELNDQNQAAPGAALAIPVHVTHNPGAPGGQVRAIEVESSANGGRTWHRVPLRRAGTHWVADVASRHGPGYVSLRAVVTTAGGASLVQTIINAYAVAR